THESLIDLNTTIHAFGGNGEGDEDLGNAGGRGGEARFFLNTDDDKVAGSLVIRANTNLRAANSSASSCERGGALEVLDASATAGGDVGLLANVNVSGGKTPHAGNQGGAGGTIVVNVAGHVTVHGVLLANGGNGGVGG